MPQRDGWIGYNIESRRDYRGSSSNHKKPQSPTVQSPRTPGAPQFMLTCWAYCSPSFPLFKVKRGLGLDHLARHFITCCFRLLTEGAEKAYLNETIAGFRLHVIVSCSECFKELPPLQTSIHDWEFPVKHLCGSWTSQKTTWNQLVQNQIHFKHIANAGPLHSCPYLFQFDEFLFWGCPFLSKFIRFLQTRRKSLVGVQPHEQKLHQNHIKINPYIH